MLSKTAGATTLSCADLSVLNPFELQTILLAKHAQHVALIHFPIALFIVGVLFDLLSRGKQGSLRNLLLRHT
jgi:hypothetical protein